MKMSRADYTEMMIRKAVQQNVFNIEEEARTIQEGEDIRWEIFGAESEEDLMFPVEPGNYLFLGMPPNSREEDALFSAKIERQTITYFHNGLRIFTTGFNLVEQLDYQIQIRLHPENNGLIRYGMTQEAPQIVRAIQWIRSQRLISEVDKIMEEYHKKKLLEKSGRLKLKVSMECTVFFGLIAFAAYLIFK